MTVIERTNARYVEPSMLPYAPDLIVVDVSFISLRTVLGRRPRDGRRPRSTRSR